MNPFVLLLFYVAAFLTGLLAVAVLLLFYRAAGKGNGNDLKNDDTIYLQSSDRDAISSIDRLQGD